MFKYKKSKYDSTSYDFKRVELIGTKKNEVEDYEIYLVK